MISTATVSFKTKKKRDDRTQNKWCAHAYIADKRQLNVLVQKSGRN
jgi:hypothetical protein